MLMKNSMESKNLFLPKTVKNFRFIVITALCLFMIGLLFPYRIYAQYSHGESVFGNGGVEKSSNDDYQVIGTVGQTNIGITSDQNNENDVGFWYGIPYCENPPIAAMEFSSDYICEGDSILFEDFSTNHCGVLFDDGISGNQLGYATYPDAGIYLVRLIALGCGVCPNDTIEVEITVCALPQPDFSIIMPDSCAPAMLYFINETLLPPPCAELEFLWDFGDNNTTTDPGYNSLQHTYDLHGTYQVCLTVSVPGLNDCLAVVCQTVTVDSCTTECDIPPIAAMEFSSDYICEGDSILFEDFSTNHCGVLFDDGISGNQLGYATYPDAGTYTVRLIALGCAGCPPDTIEVEITVCPAPQAAFELVVIDTCSPGEIFIQNMTDFDNNFCLVDQFLWLLGDGTVIDDALYDGFTFSYNEAGLYEICLIASMSDLPGCADTLCQIVVIDTCCVEPPIAAMELSSDYICEGDSILFEDFSTNHCGVLFDDGISGNQLGYATYPDAGTYTVRLIALGCAGCPPDTIEVEITVCPAPQAAFELVVIDTCSPGEIFIQNMTDFDNNFCLVDQFLWLLGDGTVIDDALYDGFTFSYNEPGLYEICLIASMSDLPGCADTLCQTVVIGTCEFDFGDAPDSPQVPNYPTLLVNDGARHLVGSNLFLGQFVDPDPDGQPTNLADGDDILDGSNDDDGVTPVSLAFLTGATPQVDVFVVNQTGLDATLTGWIDYNADGVWEQDNATEQATITIPAGFSSFVEMLFPPAPIGTTNTYARFRLTSDSILTPYGEASDGEVEDYMVSIVQLGDIDNDGNVDIDDIVDLVQGFLSGSLAPAQIVSADVNQDNIIDIVDIILIIDMIQNP